MATTTFVDQSTLIEAEWCNEVDALVHDVFSGATTQALARAALGMEAGSLATSSINSASASSFEIAHSLNTDNITVILQIVGDDGTEYAEWQASIAFPDDSSVKYLGAASAGGITLPIATPSSGSFTIRIYNEASVAQAFTIRYLVVSLD